MLVISIPTNITLTGNQTLINFHVSGSVETKPRRLNTDTMITEMKFCIQKSINLYIIIKLYRSKGLIGLTYLSLSTDLSPCKLSQITYESSLYLTRKKLNFVLSLVIEIAYT